MNKFITSNLFASKNKYILMSLLSIIIAIFIITLPSDAAKYELLLYKDYYKEQYNNLIIELFKIILPIVIIVICFEHDKAYIRSLTPNLGRDKVMIIKQYNYCLIITLSFILLNALYIIVLYIFNYYYLFDIKTIFKLFYLYLDQLLLLQLILLISRENRKIVSFLLLIIFIVSNFLLDGNQSIFLYYLLPIYSEYYSSYHNILIYKIIYTIFIISLNFIINRIEDYQ